jgi:cytochrome c oxidase assembly protein subunit 11
MGNDDVLIDERLPGARKSAKGMWLTALALLVGGMFAFAYLNAEFFIMLCQKVGILEPNPSSLRGTIADATPGRPIDVYFSANVGDGLPIAFTATRSFQKTRLNERTMNDYKFVNLSNQEIYFRPVHSVSPFRAGREEVLILEKCFCFDEQKIGPGETYILPIVYSFSDKLEDNVHVIQMNYTLFQSTREAYDAFYSRADQTGEDSPHGAGS